jgi:hypothetical protein
MGVMICHFPYHKAILAVPGFLADPIRLIGVQEFFGSPAYGTDPMWPDYVEQPTCPTLREFLVSRGYQDVLELDYQDKRAAMNWDLNLPIPTDWHETAATICDIGTIEHIADSCQVLENYLRMAKVGGHIMIHTPVHGFFGHGLHTFSPEFIVETLKANGCEVRYLAYSTDGGTEVVAEMDNRGCWSYTPAGEHIIIWIAVQKLRPTDTFQLIQQRYYQ